MASVGYSAAYIHTRESGISYNLVTPPSTPNGPWTANPPFYSLITMAEILQSDNMVKVVDLDVGGSKSNAQAGVAGYGVYDATNSTLIKVVLFNYQNSSNQFSLTDHFSIANDNVGATVKFLSASGSSENMNISWAGQTYLKVGNGTSIAAPSGSSWASPDQSLDCSSGCSVSLAGPSMAVLFLTRAPSSGEPTTSSNSNSGGSTSNTDSKSSSRAVTHRYVPWTFVYFTLAGLLALLGL